MNTLVLFLFFVPVLVAILISLNVLLSISKPDAEKVSPYECGFTPLGDSRQQFSVSFYLIAILFMIFDLEVLFLFPFAVVLYDSSLTAYWFAIIFLVILTIGFVYEWGKGALYFTRPTSTDDSASSSITPSPLTEASI